MSECRLLAGTEGQVTQLLLFCVCCATLLLKYLRSAGGRSLNEFLLDSSKQLIGAGWIHIMNLAFAERLDSQFTSLAADQCDWYWINIVVDTTLGVGVNYLLLNVFTQGIKALCPGEAASMKSGEYKTADGSINVTIYIKQLTLWIVIVTLMKGSMVMFMSTAAELLIAIATSVLSPFASLSTVKLLVVMILTPFLMNSFQFWMTDNFIKKKGQAVVQSTGNVDDDMEREGNVAIRIDHGDL
eukprot:TRINITY_DN32248_c0_g1_i1.p2 TRINITY_DN32248_c0_g1~~TRINITY_DN32248_c0_g1_i1.p2  ORF type:complete len:242 (-),score=68.82 TRINITY_DN32248_c0_g1_i1:345-1070(-)